MSNEEKAHQSNHTKIINQDKIWDYFQSHSLESFSEAKPRIDFLIKQISRKKADSVPSVLNIGAGDGYLEETLKKKGWEIYTLDPSKKVIERMAAIGIKGYNGYIEKIPFNDEQFDFVVASEVLEHLTDAQRHQGLMEIARVLKKGGMFHGTVPYRENLDVSRVICPECEVVFHRWGHQKSFDIRGLSDELSKSLIIVEIRRTAFVSFYNRPLAGKIKSLIKLILAKYGEMIATPSIYFCAKKST